MPTFEKVLGTFKEYLAEDSACEVLNTSRGYLVVDWESLSNRWVTSRLCLSPEQLMDSLRLHYEDYQSYCLTNGYKREPTDEEEQKVQRMGEALIDQCKLED